MRSELVKTWSEFGTIDRIGQNKVKVSLLGQIEPDVPQNIIIAREAASDLVHCIAAFAFAFAMAIPRCQWRHRCVVTLGKFLVVL